MHWFAPSEKDTDRAALEKRFWDAADTATRLGASPECEAAWRDFRSAKDHWSANSGLKAREYSGPILGIIFLRFAEVRFATKRAQLDSPSPLGGERARLRSEVPTARVSRRGSRVDEPGASHAEGILHPAPNARFDFLLNLLEAKEIAAKVNDVMCDIEKHNPQLVAAAPTAEQALKLLRQIQNPRRTRDLRLPRLLSGQVELL